MRYVLTEHADGSIDLMPAYNDLTFAVQYEGNSAATDIKQAFTADLPNEQIVETLIQRISLGDNFDTIKGEMAMLIESETNV
jgi:hypothetical protein